MDTNNVPEIITIDGKKYAKVLIELIPCPICKELIWDREAPYSNYYQKDIREQLFRAGIAVESNFDVREGTVCEVCKKEDKAIFKCALCQEERRSSEIRMCFGADWGREYLCTHCYETVSAKAWGQKVKDLEEEHKYWFGLTKIETKTMLEQVKTVVVKYPATGVE